MIAVFTLAALWLGWRLGANSRTYAIAIGLFVACAAIQAFYLTVWPVDSDEPKTIVYWVVTAVVFVIWLGAVWLGDQLARRMRRQRA